MAKRKYPSELNTRTIRVNIGDWHWLNSLSQKLGITVAETFHKIVIGQDHKAEPREQLSMIPVFFKPKSIEGNGAAYFKPKSISIDGAIQVKLKSIK